MLPIFINITIFKSLSFSSHVHYHQEVSNNFGVAVVIITIDFASLFICCVDSVAGFSKTSQV